MSSTCETCHCNLNEKRSKYLKCIACNLLFHFKCSGIDDQCYNQVKNGVVFWKCDPCKKINDLKVTNDPIQKQKSKKDLRPRKSSLIPVPIEINKKNEHDVLVNELKTLKMELVAEIKKVREMEIEKHLTYFSEKFDENLSNMKNNEVMSIDIQKLKCENESLCKEVDILRSLLNDVLQKNNENNIDIRGIPAIKDFDEKEIFCSIAKEISCPIQKESVVAIYRSGIDDVKSRKQSSIIVKFKSFEDKQKFQNSAKSFKSSNKKIGINNTNYTLFVNDHLTPMNKILLYETKQYAKIQNYQFTWVKNSNIYLKKDTNSVPVCIKRFKDISAYPVPFHKLFN